MRRRRYSTNSVRRHIAQRGKTPTHSLAVVKMMGDTSVAVVNHHYLNIEPELMSELVFGWKRPDGHNPCSHRRTFSARSTPLALAG